MRIISGKYKGRKITAPKNLPVRPTTDMAKEALFNILNNHYNFDELSVIDLFAGTGNIAYEFASRGTEEITAVDAHLGCVRFIDQTAKSFDFAIQAIKSDVFKFLEKTALKVDLIFADPFYDMPQKDFERIVQLVFDRNMLLPHGTLVIEHSKHTDLSNTPYFANARKYGGSVFSFFYATEKD